MLYNKKMHQNFVENYRQFIAKSTFETFLPIQRKDLLFYGWVESFFLVIVDHTDHLRFYFANIKDKDRLYYMPYRLNPCGYKTFDIIYLNNFPADFQKLVKKRGLVFNGKYHRKQETTLQRLIACCKYDITGKHIHHFSETTDLNNIDNLIPLEPVFHNLYHLDDSLTGQFLLECKKNDKLKQVKSSKYKNDEFLFQLCFLRFIKRTKIEDFKQLKIGAPSVRTLKTIFKNFIDFEAYFNSLNNHSSDFCTL